MNQKRVLLILRHMTSMENMQAWAGENNIDLTCVAMDPIVSPDEVDNALAQIKAALPTTDLVAVGTKVYDAEKGVSRLDQFLKTLQEMGLGDTPVRLTHVADFETGEFDTLKAIHGNLAYVANDDLKRHGPARFGQLILAAFNA